MDNIDPALQSYISILEKTNQQLSLWSNPYGIMIGALAVLFTVLAIVATVVIFRQSREYKRNIDADRKLYKKQIGEFVDSQKKYIEKNNKTVEEISKKTDELLQQYKDKLKESSKKQKEEIQKVIDRLELEKLTLKKDIGPITVTPNFGGGGYGGSVVGSVFGTNNLHKCSNCGFGFYVERRNPLTSVSVFSALSKATVTCPKCNNVDDIYN